MGRNNVQVGIAEKLRVKGSDEMRTLVIDPNVAQALDAPHELAVGRGKIGAPSAAKPRAALAGFQVRTSKIQARSAGGPESPAINQTREIELRPRAQFLPDQRRESAAARTGTEYEIRVCFI